MTTEDVIELLETRLRRTMDEAKLMPKQKRSITKAMVAALYEAAHSLTSNTDTDSHDTGTRAARKHNTVRAGNQVIEWTDDETDEPPDQEVPA
jgi:hypothetical protein